MKRVLWLTNIPSPYRVAFFNQLGKECELTVLFEKSASDERDERWENYIVSNFHSIILPNISVDVDKSISVASIKYIRKFRDSIIVVSNPATPTGIISAVFMKLARIPYIVESDGAFPKPVKGVKGMLKKTIYSNAKACFTTSETGKEYFLNYGVMEGNIYKYPFSSISSTYFKTIPPRSDKYKLKIELGINEPMAIISVGQFIHRKGFDILLKAMAEINNPEIGCYIVGGEPVSQYSDYCSAHQLSNVHFVPFMPPETLQKWYLAADCFVLPTREDIWGLVVNEALANGLPVITTNKCVAGLEMVSPDCGVIVESEDTNALADAIEHILYHTDYKYLAESAQRTALKFTIESMAKRHVEHFNTLYAR